MTTIVVTSLTVDSDGVISSSAHQFAFTSSGFGDDRVFAMTEVQNVAIDRVDSDLLSAAEEVSTYKLNHGGDSPFQTRADRINKRITYGTAAAAAVLTKGLSLNYQVGAGVTTGALTDNAISPESLSRTIKFENETN